MQSIQSHSTHIAHTWIDTMMIVMMMIMMCNAARQMWPYAIDFNHIWHHRPQVEMLGGLIFARQNKCTYVAAPQEIWQHLLRRSNRHTSPRLITANCSITQRPYHPESIHIGTHNSDRLIILSSLLLLYCHVEKVLLSLIQCYYYLMCTYMHLNRCRSLSPLLMTNDFTFTIEWNG